MVSVARLVGDRLHQAGVHHVFGHPGGEVVELIEGFREAGLEFVLTRHETSAAFIAEAMASATGVPGVCVATLGPGATNLVTGAATATKRNPPLRNTRRNSLAFIRPVIDMTTSNDASAYGMNRSAFATIH